ncbi:MAG: hypothetical protein PHE41_03015 [Eubacteriales bacterium]|nr:hypothetical protein [Eubacteriales bacterium]
MANAPLIEFKALTVLIILVVFIVIPVMVGTYVYRDAVRRKMNATIWALIALLTPFLAGFIVYLIVRHKNKINMSKLRVPTRQIR